MDQVFGIMIVIIVIGVLADKILFSQLEQFPAPPLGHRPRLSHAPRGASNIEGQRVRALQLGQIVDRAAIQQRVDLLVQFLHENLHRPRAAARGIRRPEGASATGPSSTRTTSPTVISAGFRRSV